MLYRIYKRKPKASDCMFDTTPPLILQGTYEKNTCKHSCSSKIVKISTILVNKITRKASVNQCLYHFIQHVWLYRIYNN